MQIGIVVKPTTWLYAENQRERIDQLFMGWAVGILDDREVEKNKWLKVITHYGYKGYIKSEELCYCSKEELYLRDELGLMAYISRNFADILELPEVRSDVCETLSRGSFIQILPELQNGFRRIRLADGREGYLPYIAYECRKDTDAFLYSENPRNYFWQQRRSIRASEQILREQLVFQGKKYLGSPYRWAGKSTEGLDCSGLTFMCYLLCGILIFRDARIESGFPIHEIAMEDMKSGDLIYFPEHVAMYIGKGRYIHATGNEKNFGCTINSLRKTDADYREDLANSIRMIGSVF